MLGAFSLLRRNCLIRFETSGAYCMMSDNAVAHLHAQSSGSIYATKCGAINSRSAVETRRFLFYFQINHFTHTWHLLKLIFSLRLIPFDYTQFCVKPLCVKRSARPPNSNSSHLRKHHLNCKHTLQLQTRRQ